MINKECKDYANCDHHKQAGSCDGCGNCKKVEYKVGDKVRIVTKRGDHWNPEGNMDRWMGKVMTIRCIDHGWYSMEEDHEEYLGNGWSWLQKDFAEKIPPYPKLTKKDLNRMLNACYGKTAFTTPKPIWDFKMPKIDDPLKQLKLYQYITTSNQYLDKQFAEYIQNDISITQQIYNKIRKDLFNMNDVYVVVGDSAYPVDDMDLPITDDRFQRAHVSVTMSPYTKRSLSSLMKSSIKIAEIPTITNVIYNDPATIVMWSDGTKTVVRADGEKYDPEKGLAMAMCKKHAGNKRDYYHTFLHWLKKAPKKEYKSEVETAYGLLNGVLSNPKATKDDMTAAMQEALGFLGEALDD